MWEDIEVTHKFLWLKETYQIVYLKFHWWVRIKIWGKFRSFIYLRTTHEEKHFYCRTTQKFLLVEQIIEDLREYKNWRVPKELHWLDERSCIKQNELVNKMLIIRYIVCAATKSFLNRSKYLAEFFVLKNIEWFWRALSVYQTIGRNSELKLDCSGLSLRW